MDFINKYKKCFNFRYFFWTNPELLLKLLLIELDITLGQVTPWLGAIKQQAKTWTNVDQDLCCNMASLPDNGSHIWQVYMTGIWSSSPPPPSCHHGDIGDSPMIMVFCKSKFLIHSQMTDGFLEWINNFIPHFIMDVINGRSGHSLGHVLKLEENLKLGSWM